MSPTRKDCVYVCPFLCSYCFQAFVQQQSIFIKVLGLPNTWDSDRALTILPIYACARQPCRDKVHSLGKSNLDIWLTHAISFHLDVLSTCVRVFPHGSWCSKGTRITLHHLEYHFLSLVWGSIYPKMGMEPYLDQSHYISSCSMLVFSYDTYY